jgi:hypothetical protein
LISIKAPQHEEYLLEKVKMQVSLKVDARFQGMSIHKQLEYLTDEFSYHLTVLLMCGKKSTTKVAETIFCPTDWKEAVKEVLYTNKHIPNFIKLKYPVKYRCINTKILTEETNIYPNFDHLIPENHQYTSIVMPRPKM